MDNRIQNFYFKITKSLISVSFWYAYDRMSRTERRLYKHEPRSQSLKDTIDLGHLYDLRLADFPAYAVLGSHQLTDQWLEYGVEQGLLPHDWRDEIDLLLEMDRADANRLLLGLIQDK